MSKFWNENVKRLVPYVPGEQPQDKKYIKINTNECPYPPSPRAIEAIKKAACETLRLYPDPECNELREILAQYYGLSKEQIFVGNGSDEVLAFAFMTFFNPDEETRFPDISYTFYPVYSELFNLKYTRVPVDDEFFIHTPHYENSGGVVISNPNAPTGIYLSIDEIREILVKNAGRVVIIDEAYIDFGGESAVKLINSFPNLLVVHTLSKSRALAGLRVGYAMGNSELIDGLNRVKNSFNSYTLDRLAIVGAAEAVRDDAYFREITDKIIRTRERVSEELKKMDFDVPDSKANFVFAGHRKVPGEVIFKKLKERGILVRHFKKPRIENYLRISIGTDEEMDSLLRELTEILAQA